MAVIRNNKKFFSNDRFGFNIGAYLVYHCKSIGFSLESRRLYSETPLQ